MIHSCVLKRVVIASTVLAALVCLAGQPLVGRLTAREQSRVNEILIGFAQLGYFSDRGLVGRFMENASKEENHPVQNSKPLPEVPQELQELLKPRHGNGVGKLPGIAFIDLAAPRSESPTEKTVRLLRFGVIELFNCEDSRLLEMPLTDRKELMEKCNSIADQVNGTMAALYNKERDIHLVLAIAGRLRALSVELDMEILSSLSDIERERLSEILVHLTPLALKDASTSNSKHELGSPIVEWLQKTAPKGIR